MKNPSRKIFNSPRKKRENEKEKKNNRNKLIYLARDMRDEQLVRRIFTFKVISEWICEEYLLQNKDLFDEVKSIEWPFKKGEVPENCTEMALIFCMNKSAPELPKEFFVGLEKEESKKLSKFISEGNNLEDMKIEDFAKLVLRS